jgi:hypothetical protein
MSDCGVEVFFCSDGDLGECFACCGIDGVAGCLGWDEFVVDDVAWEALVSRESKYSPLLVSSTVANSYLDIDYDTHVGVLV